MKKGEFLMDVLLTRHEKTAAELCDAYETIERLQGSHRRLRSERDEAEQARRSAIETSGRLRDLVIHCQARLGLPPDCEPLPPLAEDAEDRGRFLAAENDHLRKDRDRWRERCGWRSAEEEGGLPGENWPALVDRLRAGLTRARQERDAFKSRGEEQEPAP